MTETSHTRRKCNRAGIFWITVLVASLFVQRILNDAVKQGTGDFTTGVLIVILLSAFYGRYILCCTQKSEQEPIDDAENMAEDDIQQQQEDKSNTTNGAGTGIDNTDDGLGFEDEVTPVVVATPRKRVYFLDNIKIFLTMLVVSHHVSCAFGACGPGGWILIVGLDAETNTFAPFEFIFVILNQGYFMSFFFFISGYFVPSSYERKGTKKFLKDKAKRLWIPAFFITFIMAPSLIVYCQWIIGDKNFVYTPNPFQSWFIYWLLLLNLVYVSIQEEEKSAVESEEPLLEQYIPGESAVVPNNNDNNNATSHRPLAGPIKRIVVYGCGICGLVGMIFLSILPTGSFAGMPIAIGSLPNDLLCFTGGIIAKKHGWLEEGNMHGSLKEQIGMPVILLRCLVILEATLTVFFLKKSMVDPSDTISGSIFLLAAGMYCIDMILALGEFFQSNLNFQNSWTKILSDSAYTVYLIHPVVIVGVSSLWIALYGRFFDAEPLEWTELYSNTPIKGGGLTIGVSWIVCNILSHVIVWPISHYLRKLPGLREIL